MGYPGCKTGFTTSPIFSTLAYLNCDKSTLFRLVLYGAYSINGVKR